MDKEKEMEELSECMCTSIMATNNLFACIRCKEEGYCALVKSTSKSVVNAYYRKSYEVRKETAKEILQELYGWDNKIDDMILVIADAYGVEVK